MMSNLGRLLLTIADVATVIAPIAADWNDSHIFNEEWPSHARFHGVVGLGTASGLAALALWRLWRKADADLAAAVPAVYWGSFFPALFIRGTGVDDEPHRVGTVAGVPANLFYAALTTFSAIGGWMLDRRLRSAR